MALFGSCFPGGHTVMAACYRDVYATNFNLLIEKVQVTGIRRFNAAVVENLRSIRFDGGTTVVSAGGPSSRKAVCSNMLVQYFDGFMTLRYIGLI